MTQKYESMPVPNDKVSKEFIIDNEPQMMMVNLLSISSDR